MSWISIIIMFHLLSVSHTKYWTEGLKLWNAEDRLKERDFSLYTLIKIAKWDTTRVLQIFCEVSLFSVHNTKTWIVPSKWWTAEGFYMLLNTYMPFCTPCNAKNFCHVFTFKDLISQEMVKTVRKFTLISFPRLILRLASRFLVKIVRKI